MKFPICESNNTHRQLVRLITSLKRKQITLCHLITRPNDVIFKVTSSERDSAHTSCVITSQMTPEIRDLAPSTLTRTTVKCLSNFMRSRENYQFRSAEKRKDDERIRQCARNIWVRLADFFSYYQRGILLRRVWARSQ